MTDDCENRTLVRVSEACRRFGLDQASLNTAIWRGVYPNAPPTAKGSPRLLDEAQLRRLEIYARLLDFGLTPKAAGTHSVRLAATNKPIAELLARLRAAFGLDTEANGEDVAFRENRADPNAAR